VKWDDLGYWAGLPLRWLGQVAHNGHGILRVLDITKWRPLAAGLVALDHPWVTGICPTNGQPIWPQNVIFRTPPNDHATVTDDEILTKTGRYLADAVERSATLPEIPRGPLRRMPHAINYIHGSSHYNSGILLFNDFTEALAHFTDPAFRREIHRFVRTEQREVLMLFRQRDYSLREFAYFVGALRTLFPWFCNSNGPKGKVLWGNAAPYAAANLITGRWIDDVYALKTPGGAARVVRDPIAAGGYFPATYGHGRTTSRWPERMLAWLTYYRVRLRGGKGGMFFVDRREVYADQIDRRARLGLVDEPIAPL